MPVSEEKVNALSYIEEVWWSTTNIPTFENMSEVLGVSVEKVRSYFADSKFREALQTRGIPLRQIESPEDTTFLSLPQLDCVNMLINTIDRRTRREKFKELGISTMVFQKWMNDPRFKQYLEKRVSNAFNGAEATARLVLINKVESGDMKAVQLLLEMQGAYTPRSQVDINLHTLMPRLIEVIARHVDTATMAAIADDFDVLMGVEPKQSLGSGFQHEVEVRSAPKELVLNTTATETPDERKSFENQIRTHDLSDKKDEVFSF